MSQHKQISIVKSIVRICGYILLGLAIMDHRVVCSAIVFLIVSEGIGIIEEWGEK